MSSGPMAGRVRAANTWCSRSVITVADQEQQQRDTTVPVQDGTSMEIRSADCDVRTVGVECQNNALLK